MTTPCLERDAFLNDMAYRLYTEIEASFILGDDRLRRIAYKGFTSKPITPEMDRDIILRIGRLRQAASRQRQADSTS